MQSKHAIVERSRQANRDLIDLTAYYTASLDEDWVGVPGGNLAALPQGVQVFAEAAFDMRGVIQLAGQATTPAKGRDFPSVVEGIKVNHQGRRLHFLHGAVGETDQDTRIGDYVLHYADGRTVEVPIIYQRQVRNWWTREGEPLPTDADIAWTGATQVPHRKGDRIQLYRYRANSPFPNAEIVTMDFRSAMTESAPFLIALTVEPNEPVYEGFSMARIDRFCPIPPRDPQASPDLVDLSDYYTSSLDDNWFCHAGHDLRDLPKGIQTLGNVTYDVRGLVQLAASKSLDVTGVVFPESVKGIAVHRTGRRLHFLQACFWNTAEGTKIGEYVIRYADGQTRTAPIVYGRNIRDWWAKPGEERVPEAATAWRGANPATRSMDMITHLMTYTWENPLPGLEIRSIDFVSDLVEAGPFLVAMTVEPVSR